MDKIKIDWGTIIRYGLILLAIAAVCTALLALTNMITLPVINERNLQANQVAKENVLPEATSFEPVDNVEQIKEDVPENGDIIDEIDIGYQGDQVVGYTVKTLPKGYGGEIELLTGVSEDGQITGIDILEQSETAGLGARSTEPEFKEQFKEKSAEEEITVEKSGPAEGNEIQAISGATITSTAVAEGVNTSANAVALMEEINE